MINMTPYASVYKSINRWYYIMLNNIMNHFKVKPSTNPSSFKHKSEKKSTRCEYVLWYDLFLNGLLHTKLFK